MTDFDLWLEFEIGDPADVPANRPAENFANIIITLEDEAILPERLDI